MLFTTELAWLICCTLPLCRLIPPSSTVLLQHLHPALLCCCMQPCQLRLCQALADFYKASNNITDPWDNEYGWEKTSTMSCEQLIKGSNRQAEYCSWWGVRCCTPQGMADGRCSAVNTIVALKLQINNVNCSLQNPLVLPSFKILHGCGMRVLNLEANNIIGYLSEDFGELNKLIVFNFGELLRHCNGSG